MTGRFGKMTLSSLLLFAVAAGAADKTALPMRPEEAAAVRQIEAEFTRLKLQLEIVRLRACLSHNLKLEECGQFTQDGTAITKIEPKPEQKKP